MATAISTAKSAVTTLLSSAESLEGIKVTDDKQPERVKEYIWIHSAKAKREFKLIGPQIVPQEEIIQIALVVVAMKGNKETSPSFDRAMEIFEAAELVLRENITLEDTVFYHNIEDVEINPIPSDALQGHTVVGVLRAKARI